MAVTISSNPTTSLRLSILSIPSTSSTRNLQTISCFNGGGGSSSSSCSSRLLTRDQRKLGFWNGVSVRRKRLVVSCGVAEIDQSQFPETVLKSQLPVLVEFVADWCGPCRLIAPAIDWASKAANKFSLERAERYIILKACTFTADSSIRPKEDEYEDRLTIVKINHDKNPQLIEEYKVYGLPALIFFKNGKEVSGSRREGAMTKAKLKEYIDTLLESAAVA